MTPNPSNSDAQAIAALSEMLLESVWVMSALHGDRRAGLRVRSVMSTASEPPLLAVAIPRGHRIDPIIRDARRFGLSRVRPDDRLVLSKFPVVPGVRYLDELDPPGVPGGDPFDALGISMLTKGTPVLDRSDTAVGCTVVRHYDLEADHALYIGQMIAVRING